MRNRIVAIAIAIVSAHGCGTLQAPPDEVAVGADAAADSPPEGGLPPAACPPSEPCVESVALGDYFTCALLSSGELRCWGRNDSGAVGNGQIGADVTTPTTVQNLDRRVTKVAA